MFSISRPKDDSRDDQHRLVVDCPLLVARCHPPKLLEPVDRPLDHVVALAVGLLVQAPSALFVLLAGELHRPDAPPAQVVADLLGGVTLVSNHPLGADTGPSPPRSLYRSCLHQSFEHAPFVPLTGGGDQDGHGLPPTAFDTEMDLGREPAPAPSEGLRIFSRPCRRCRVVVVAAAAEALPFFASPSFAKAACWCVQTTLPST